MSLLNHLWTAFRSSSELVFIVGGWIFLFLFWAAIFVCLIYQARDRFKAFRKRFNKNDSDVSKSDRALAAFDSGPPPPSLITAALLQMTRPSISDHHVCDRGVESYAATFVVPDDVLIDRKQRKKIECRIAVVEEFMLPDYLVAENTVVLVRGPLNEFIGIGDNSTMTLSEAFEDALIERIRRGAVSALREGEYANVERL